MEQLVPQYQNRNRNPKQNPSHQKLTLHHPDHALTGMVRQTLSQPLSRHGYSFPYRTVLHERLHGTFLHQRQHGTFLNHRLHIIFYMGLFYVTDYIGLFYIRDNLGLLYLRDYKGLFYI